jgi:FkbM family methyltransferase
MFDWYTKTLQEFRQWLRRRLLRQGHRQATVCVNGFRMTLDLRDPVISDWLFIQRTWEPYESSLMARALRPGATFVDVGAHIGYYTLLAAREVGRRGRVLAFEPAPENYALLAHNVRQNHLEQVVQTANLAVSERSQELTLYLCEQNNGDHRIYPTTPNDDKLFNYGQTRKPMPVRAISLDEYLEQHPVGPIDMIKLDVQGAELKVLRGMQTTLQQNPNVTLFMEYWPYGLRQSGSDPAQLLSMLSQQAGMSLLQILPNTKQVRPITVKELSASTFHPTLQVDLICRRDLAPFLSKRAA